MILGAAETIVGSRLVFSTGIVTCLVNLLYCVIW